MMSQRTPYRCQRHSKLMGEGPGLRCFDPKCLAEGKDAEIAASSSPVVPATAPKLEPVEAPRTEPKAKSKASSSRWAEYGRKGGRVGGIKISPAKAAAAKLNGARGGRPRKIGKATVAA